MRTHAGKRVKVYNVVRCRRYTWERGIVFLCVPNHTGMSIEHFRMFRRGIEFCSEYTYPTPRTVESIHFYFSPASFFFLPLMAVLRQTSFITGIGAQHDTWKPRYRLYSSFSYNFLRLSTRIPSLASACCHGQLEAKIFLASFVFVSPRVLPCFLPCTTIITTDYILKVCPLFAWQQRKKK